MPDVILPVLDEAAAIPGVLAAMPAGYRPIVVDNGSTDGSAAIAAELGARGGRRTAPRLRRRLLRRPRAPPTPRSSASWTATARSIPPTCRGSSPCSTRAPTWRSAPAAPPAAPGPSTPGSPTGSSPASCAAAPASPLEDIGPMRAARRQRPARARPARPPQRLAAGDGGQGGRRRLVGGRHAGPLRRAPGPLEGDRHGARDDPGDRRHGRDPPRGRPNVGLQRLARRARASCSRSVEISCGASWARGIRLVVDQHRVGDEANGDPMVGAALDSTSIGRRCRAHPPR